ncbi:alpha/beta fold hydrolase [Pelomyxa schiedti]|nr:alpha/beta fold hydrolase [Pelomyxa schiedti]
MSATKTERNCVIKLGDGRDIGYSLHGRSHGPHSFVLFLFPGIPGNRLFLPPTEARFLEIGRIYVLDRPGFGLSTYAPRSLLDWPSDVEEVADQLGIQKFSVAGYSAGGPFAVACAYKIPHRLNSVHIISSLSPPEGDNIYEGMTLENKFSYFIASHCYPMLWAALQCGAGMTRSFGPQRGAMKKEFSQCPGDSTYINSHPETVEIFLNCARENIGKVGESPHHEYSVITRDWGFQLTKILCDAPIHVWHGLQDTGCGRGMLNLLIKNIPNCIPHLSPAEGHLLIFEHWSEILHTVVTDSATASTLHTSPSPTGNHHHKHKARHTAKRHYSHIHHHHTHHSHLETRHSHSTPHCHYKSSHPAHSKQSTHKTKHTARDYAD